MSIIAGSADVRMAAGTHIHDAAECAVDLAKQIRGQVHFEFNLCHFYVEPRTTVAEVEERYEAYCEYEKLKRRASSADGEPR